MILRVEDLNVSFNGQTIIKDLSFYVREHEILCIMGPNGAGKTTLLRALLGLIPYKGKIVWAKKRISYLPPQEFLQRQELPPLTIEEFYALKGAKRKETLKMLKLVGLNRSMANRAFTSLSTGEFQRMLIGWALIGRPDVLLLDEPTSGIDIGGEETIYTLLYKFWKSWKLTILLVTHDLSIVWKYAHRVLCLNKRLFCYGMPKKILTPTRLKALYGMQIKFYTHRHG